MNQKINYGAFNILTALSITGSHFPLSYAERLDK